MYNQNYQNQQNQQNQQPLPNQPGNNFYQNRYDVRETICPVFDEKNRCNYVYGIATVYLPSYKATMTLEMHVRNCINPRDVVDNGCYRRDTNYGYFEVKHFFQDRLQFLGSASVQRFIGDQCYCNSDLCYPNISSSPSLVASASSLVLAVLTFILFK
ncbi:uncharacterized protein LOC132751711 [Ruditapes philippinarum]|uniref:uncharacterized protein LOC132751711 n=1 Tax=Ruditapes philippinarum TaxID=129788 RepID=UPI00295BE397|nr:uncharacterized protein LOC132751711 [Ruditapes philippinarum]